MRLILKLIAAPLILLLTVLVAVLLFLFSLSSFLLTAASAIAALQEAGSKLSRDMLKSSYRSFAKECYFIIDLMRQFYDESRVYRITYLVIAFLLAPYGLQAVAGAVITGLDSLNLSLRQFITS